MLIQSVGRKKAAGFILSHAVDTNATEEKEETQPAKKAADTSEEKPAKKTAAKRTAKKKEDTPEA